MVGLRAKVLGRLGRRPHPRACALSCPSLAVGGPGSLLWVNPGPRLAAKASGGPIGTAPQTIARAPTTASAASTQKSMASMHSPLSLVVGYNTVVTHGRRSCNNVVAI